MKFSGHKTCFIFISYLILLGFPGKINAAYFSGGEFEWTCVGQDSFMITLTLYKDCSGLPLSAVNIPITCISNGASVTNLTIEVPSPVGITPTCAGSCNTCQSVNCSFIYGIEQYTFTKLVVLSNAGSCCKIGMSYYKCCRSNSISTGAAYETFFLKAELNRCLSPCDNSPSFSQPPIAIACKDQDFQHNFGLTDFDINSAGELSDSLSYEWTSPLSNIAATIAYTDPYSYDKPIYFWGFPTTSLPYPRGFHLDSGSGEVTFRPMKIENTVMVIKIKEWRMINGLMTQIGEITRDFQVFVISCPANCTPLLSSPYVKEICPSNTVTFSINTNDYDSQDTLLISWNNAIQGASWTDNNMQVKHPTATFSWTPDERMARTAPYEFKVTVKDNACPINAQTTKAYKIFVRPLPDVNAGLDVQICQHAGKFPLRGFPSNPPGNWAALNGNAVEDSAGIYYFDPNNKGIIPATDNYLVYSFSDTAGCKQSDTLIINVSDAHLSISRDDTIVCKNEVLHIEASYYPGNGVKWYVPFSSDGIISGTDTDKFIEYIPGKNDLDQLGFWIKASTQDSICPAGIDSVYIHINRLIVDFFTSDTLIDHEGTAKFTDLSVSNLSPIIYWKWDFLDNTGASAISYLQNPTHTYLDTGYYDVGLRVETAEGCSDSTIKKNYIRVYDCIGLPEANQDMFRIYPNPATDYVYIKIDNNTNLIKSVILLNNLGQLMMFHSEFNNSAIYMNCHTMNAGMYLLKIELIKGGIIYTNLIIMK